MISDILEAHWLVDFKMRKCLPVHLDQDEQLKNRRVI